MGTSPAMYDVAVDIFEVPVERPQQPVINDLEQVCHAHLWYAVAEMARYRVSVRRRRFLLGRRAKRRRTEQADPAAREKAPSTLSSRHVENILRTLTLEPLGQQACIKKNKNKPPAGTKPTRSCAAASHDDLEQACHAFP